MLRSANFSRCRTYRYALRRQWVARGSVVLFVGLNPSTADEEVDDPTIRRCIGFARDWGYGGMIMANLFAYRATHPAELKRVPEPIGPRNNLWLAALAKQVHLVVCAWGNHGTFLQRDQNVLRRLSRAYCLGRTQSGQPRHPLYLSRTIKPRLLTA
jgi:hypothetical protein